MNIEQNRLETFNDWPMEASVSPQRIAKAGFYYTKRDQEVECFACGLKISSWNYGDQVMARHKTLSPNCPFVLNSTTSGNVPSLAMSPSSSASSSSLDYRNEAVRLASFDQWPVPHIVSPEDLARAGFYSVKNGDNTKCAYCNGVVRAWEPHDVPDIEHQRHFPNCSFVLNVINPRLEERNSRREADTSSTTAFTNISLKNSSVDGNLDELGVQKHNGPKRPDFGTVDSRLRSFTTWSPHLIQTPSVLAQAGFYYEGLSDQVRCFHCDGGLRHWDPDDDPWTEHARWFPRCSFVNLVKGHDFVAACSLDNVTENRDANQKVQTAPSSTKTAQPKKKKRHVTEEELNAQMVSDVAIAALNIGIDVQRVRRAMKEKLEWTGVGYSQPDALVEAALNVQHEEEHQEDNNDEEYDRELATTFERTTNRRPLLSRRNDSAASAAAAAAVTREGADVAATGDTCQSPTGNGESAAHEGDPLSLTATTIAKPCYTLEEENRLLKEQRQCKICMDAEVGIVFLPCGHLATCVNCAPNLEDCPVCRSRIKATVRTFLA